MFIFPRPIRKSTLNQEGTTHLTHSFLQGIYGSKLIISIKCLIDVYFSKCCFNVSLCRTRCEFGIAIISGLKNLKIA